jgi:molybdopterin/thiamine biosynthesis adenylyltransferase
MLSDPQIERYSRQIILPQVGGKGQERLLHARVLVSRDAPWHVETLLYLAAAGVGRIGIYGTEHLPLWTALAPEPQSSAVTTLQRLNPDCSIVIHDRQDHQNVVPLVQQYGLVIAEPNVQLHAACYATEQPFLCGQVSATTAWLAVYRGYEKHSPCLSCVPMTLSETASPLGIAELAGSFIGTVLATEAIKLLLGLNPSGPTKLLQYTFPDLLSHVRVLAKDPNCPVCRHSE